MQLIKYLNESDCLAKQSAENVESAFEMMLGAIYNEEFQNKNVDIVFQELKQAVIDREKERSTSLGNGIAFPHAKIENLQAPAISIATLKKPVKFNNGSDVDVICMIISPSQNPTISLKITSLLIRYLSDKKKRQHIRDASTGKEILNLLSQADMRVDTPIFARDIMRAPKWFAYCDTPLKEVAKTMYTNRIHAFPVLDHEKKIIGDITSNRLFRYGIPDFFSQLKSVSFIAEYDPFEKYFEHEADTMAQDLIVEEVGIIPPEYTIMEIIFALTVKKYPKLYVVDKNGNWIGTIDQGIVLDNIINF